MNKAVILGMLMVAAPAKVTIYSSPYFGVMRGDGLGQHPTFARISCYAPMTAEDDKVFAAIVKEHPKDVGLFMGQTAKLVDKAWGCEVIHE